MSSRRFELYDLGFFTLCVLSVVPLWLVQRPPLQDFPQHLATVRVLLDHGDPLLKLANVIGIDLSRTQYLTFYMAACALAKVFGVVTANKLLLSAALFSTPYALSGLLRAIGGDRRLALIAFPLTYNAHVLLGFLNFVSAIPLALWPLGISAQLRRESTTLRRVLLAVLMLVLFYTHVVPFGFAFVGSSLLLWYGPQRARLLNYCAMIPALVGALYWTQNNPAGESTLVAASRVLSQRTQGGTRFDPLQKTIHEWPEWVTDVLPGSLDVVLLSALCLLLVAVVPLSLRSTARKSEQRSAYYCLCTLAPAAVVASFVMPYQHEWIWPVAGRFPYLAVLFLPLVFAPMPTRMGNVWAGLVALLGLVHISQNASAFLSYNRQEVAGFDGALASIPNGSRVVGLMYSANSAFVGEHPFMHYVAYSQAEKGGVVEYSFAETRQSPLYYVPPDNPPKVNLGYGWAPQASNPRQFSSYFDYVLSRGEHVHLRNVERYYERIYEKNHWGVWKRRAGVQNVTTK